MNFQYVQFAGSLFQLMGWTAPVVVIAILLFRINARYGVGIGGAPVLSGGAVMILTLLFKAILQYQFGTAHGLFQIVAQSILLIGSILVAFGTSQIFDILVKGRDERETRAKQRTIWTILLSILGGSIVINLFYALLTGSNAELVIFNALYNANIAIAACIYLTFGLVWLAQARDAQEWLPWVLLFAGAMLLVDGVITTYNLKFHISPVAYTWLRTALGLVTALTGIAAVALARIGTNRLMQTLAPATVNASILQYKSSVQKRFVLVLSIAMIVIGATGYMILEVIQSSRQSVEETYLNEQRKVAESVAANMEGLNNSILAALAELAQQPGVQDAQQESMRARFSETFAVWKNVSYSISRLDEHGILRYVYPERPGIAGSDISQQLHVKRFLAVRDTIFSGVFRSIQGSDAFGLYVPVYARNNRGGGVHFAGGVAMLFHIDAYAMRAFRNSSIFTPNPLAAVNFYGRVIVSNSHIPPGEKLFDYLPTIFPSLTNRDTLEAMTLRIADLSSPAFIRVVASAADRDPQWIVAHPVTFTKKPWGVIMLPVSSSEIYAVYADTVGRQMIVWGAFSVLLVILLGTLVVIFYRWSRFLEEEVNHELRVVRETEGKYARLVNEAVVGIFQTTTDGRLISANPSMASMLGFDSIDALMAFDVFRVPADASRIGVPWDQIRQGAGLSTPVRIAKADGSVASVLVHCKAVTGADGSIERYEGFIEDVTDRNRLEQQLIQAQKLEGIGTLAGGIAHDFNNLLAMILGSAELLRFHARENAQLKKYVDRIIEASERGASISRQLLIFSRPDQAELQPVLLTQIIKELEDMLTHFLPKSVAVETHLRIGPSIIMGDAGHLHQAMLNLALNANDAMPEGGILSISAMRVESDIVQKKFPSCQPTDYVSVSIADTGVGMDESTKSKMFDPFFSTKERGKGTGLGLAIVHGIVMSHQGFIDVESVPMRGTVFTLYFPVVDERHAGAGQSSASGRGEHLHELSH